MKMCFFIGHRDAPGALRPALDEAIERHITVYGVWCNTPGTGKGRLAERI